MALISYSAKAPGTLMLLGEHAVLQDKTAIVMAVDQWISVRLTTRFDQKLQIDSQLGNFRCDLVDLDTRTFEKPFEFVLAAIQSFKKKIIENNIGFNLIIHSEFKQTLGLGSSAAVTVATLAVLYRWLENDSFLAVHLSERSAQQIFESAITIIRTVQGVGSGADVAASVYGGIILYQQKSPYILKKIFSALPLTVVYSGSKTPTPMVIRQVEALREKYPKIIQALYESMDYAVKESIALMEAQDWQGLGEIFSIQQGIMNALGVSSPVLNQLVDRLDAEPGIYGSKISGAGLGDCVIGIGAQRKISDQTLEILLSRQGLHYV